MGEKKTAAIKNLNVEELLKGVKFVNDDSKNPNTAEIVVRNGMEVDDSGKANEDYSIDYAQVNVIAKDESALKDAVKNAASNGSTTVIVPNKTAKEVQTLINAWKTEVNGINVAIAATDGNVILGTASAPNNKPSLVAGVPQVAGDAEQAIVGSIEDGQYYLLAGGTSSAFVKWDGTKFATTQDTTDPDALWQVSVSTVNGTKRYVFKNKYKPQNQK